MRIREMIIASALFFGGVGLVACDNSKKDTAAEAESPDEKKEGEEGASKAPDAPEKEGEGDAKEEASAEVGELPFEATGPVATVNSNEIAAERFNEEVTKMVKVTQGRVPPQMLGFYKKQILSRLVDEYLLNKKVKEEGISVTDAELDEEYAKFKKRFPDQAQFEMFKKRMGVTDDELKQDMRTQVLHKKYLEKKHGVTVTDEEIKKYYEENTKRFEQEEQVKAAHILLKVPEDADDAKVKEVEKKAKELAQQARKDGADFAALAKEHSEGPSGPRGGDLGFFPKKRMVPAFSKAAFSMKKGEVSDPVKTNFGWHVIKVEDKKEGKTQSFDEVKDQIEEMLYTQKIRKTLNEVMTEIKKDADIKYNEDNITMNVEVPKKGGGNPFGGGGMPGAGGHNHGGSGHSHDGGKGNAPKLKLKGGGDSNAPKLKLKGGGDGNAPKLKLKGATPKPTE